jgi:tetratricopeptide (TPR) repeat protein
MLAAASGPFAVYVNGHLAGRGLGSRETPVAVWEHFAMGTLLHEGENVILISVLGSGAGDWLRCECEIAGDDGRSRELHSGTPWQVWRDDAWQRGGLAPVAAAYLAARGKSGWMAGQIGEENWQQAIAVQGPMPRVWSPLAAIDREVPARAVTLFGEVDAAAALSFVDAVGTMREVKFVHREALMTPGKMQALVQTRSEGRAAYLVLDFGRVLCGYPRLRLRGQEGAIVDLGFARQQGELETGLRYICAETKSEWTAPAPVSCRYVVVRVSSCPIEMEMDCVSLVERCVEVEADNSFVAVPLTPLWDVGLRSLAAVRREVYLEAPGGSRGDWMRHYIMSLNDYYRTGNVVTAGAALQSAALPQDAIESAFFALCAAAHYRFSGDKEIAAKTLPSAQKALADCTDLSAQTASWALRAGALAQLGAALGELGQQEVAERCRQQAEDLCAGIALRWDVGRGLVVDEEGGEHASQWANALVLYFALLPGEQLKVIGENMRAVDVRVADLWQAFFLVGGLWQIGMGERAVEYVDAHWGRLLEREGGTWANKAGILAALPGVDALLGAYGLGVVPLAAGGEVLEVRPQLEGLMRAKGRFCIGGTVVDIDWSVNPAGYFSLAVEREREGELHLAVPRLGKRFPTVSLNGENVWRNEKVYPNFHVREVISEEEHVVLVVHKAGRYTAELSA